MRPGCGSKSVDPDIAHDLAVRYGGEKLRARRVELASLEGTPVLLEFWSMGCAPCRATVPKLRAYESAWGDRLRVVTMHVDLTSDESQDTDEIASFVREQGITWPVGIDSTGTPWRRFSFGYLPYAVIIDASCHEACREGVCVVE